MPGFSGVSVGSFDLSGFGVSWSWSSSGGGGSLGLGFDALFDLEWLKLKLPGLGFDFALPDVGGVSVKSKLPSLSCFCRDVRSSSRPTGPGLPDVPGFPGLPGPGLSSGWWRGTPGLGVPELFDLLGLTLPEFPDIFTPALRP